MMDSEAKKTALRMIPYGLYVLTAAAEGETGAATVNWVTQASFDPPLVVVGVKADSETYRILSASGAFALNVLGKGQNDIATSFFKPAIREGNTINDEHFHDGVTGSPILASTPAYVECRVIERLERGDHAVVVGEVVEAGVASPPEGRADDATLWLKDLGERVFYGG
jgi:flavin reductase (DIM6/NTAB) family NADH-FMN oxidoreductase RutF